MTPLLMPKAGITDDPHLNALMAKHAEYSGRTGYTETVGQVLDEKLQRYVDVTSKTSNYSAYVAGRNRRMKIDGSPANYGLRETQTDSGNDFNQSLWAYLDIYLNEVIEEAKTLEDARKAENAQKPGEATQETISLDVLMKQRFKIGAAIQSPAQFFSSWPDLSNQLKDMDLSVADLKVEDINTAFIETLISGDAKQKDRQWASISLRNEKAHRGFEKKCNDESYRDYISGLEKRAGNSE